MTAAADQLETYRLAVATVIAALRNEAGLTQEQLAQRLGWGRHRVAAIEAGRRVEVAEIFALADALQIDFILLMLRIKNWALPAGAYYYRAMEQAAVRVNVDLGLGQTLSNPVLGWLRNSSNPFVSMATMPKPPEPAVDGLALLTD